MSRQGSPSVPELLDAALTAPLDKPVRCLRVLVVDDDPNVRALMAAGLRGDGHEVKTASNSAWALALHMEEPFDAVVIDLVLLGERGVLLGTAVKRLNPNTPVIIVTAYPQELKDCPFDLMIPKPFPHCVLRAALDLFCTR